MRVTIREGTNASLSREYQLHSGTALAARFAEIGFWRGLLYDVGLAAGQTLGANEEAPNIGSASDRFLL